MKNIKRLLLGLVLIMSIASCTSVESGNKGVIVSYGGATDMDMVLDEGMHYGIRYVIDETIDYNIKEKTLKRKFSFNDSKDMPVDVTIALDYALSPMEVNKLHKFIDDVSIKIETAMSAGAKSVVPKFTAVELNKTGRAKAELMLDSILKKEMKEFFVDYKRIRITDVDLPKGISALATKTAIQIGKNELASKMEEEKLQIAKAVVAEAKGAADAKVTTAKGDFEAAEYDAEAKKLLSQPAMIKLVEANAEFERAKNGSSKYGTHNFFGASAPHLLKNLK